MNGTDDPTLLGIEGDIRCLTRCANDVGKISAHDKKTKKSVKAMA